MKIYIITDKYLDESKEIQVAFFQAKFGRGEQSNYIEHCFVVVVLITIFLQICHNKYQVTTLNNLTHMQIISLRYFETAKLLLKSHNYNLFL